MNMHEDTGKKKVLFVCTHNAVRSQIAEAFLNTIYGNRYSAFSAGSDPTQLHPLVRSVMDEIGVDVCRHISKGLEIFQNDDFDLVVTVCDNALETCPFFPKGSMRIHKSFADPSAFGGEPEQVMQKFRFVRDEIRNWIEKAFGEKST